MNMKPTTDLREPVGTFERTPEVQAMSVEEIDVRSAMEMLGYNEERDRAGSCWSGPGGAVVHVDTGNVVNQAPLAWDLPIIFTPAHRDDVAERWRSLRRWYAVQETAG